MHDSLLEHVIALAEEDTPIEAEVTLIVGGMLVTGHVIGYDAYMAHHPLTKAFLEASSEDEDEADAEEDVGTDGEEADDDSDEEEDFDDEGAYVHLRDAHCHAPGQAPAGNASFYRIALSDVSGFSLAP